MTQKYLDEKGWAMPLVLIVMLVITLLGTALWFYSMTDLKHVAREEKKMQAYYLARSGVELLADNLTEYPGTGETWTSLGNNFDGVGYFDLTVTGYESTVIIKAIGNVDNVRETLELEINLADNTRKWKK